MKLVKIAVLFSIVLFLLSNEILSQYYHDDRKSFLNFSYAFNVIGLDITNKLNEDGNYISMAVPSLSFDYNSKGSLSFFGKVTPAFASYPGVIAQAELGLSLSKTQTVWLDNYGEPEANSLFGFTLNFGVRKHFQDIDYKAKSKTFKGHINDIVIFSGICLNQAIDDWYSIFFGNVRLYLYLVYGIKDREESKFASDGVLLNKSVNEGNYFGILFGGRAFLFDFEIGALGGFYASFGGTIGYTFTF